MIRRPPRSTLFPTRRSSDLVARIELGAGEGEQQGEAVRHEHVTTVRTIDQPVDQRAGRHEVHRVAGHAYAGAEEVVARVEVPEPELAVPNTLDQPAAATLHSRPVGHADHAVGAVYHGQPGEPWQLVQLVAS